MAGGRVTEHSFVDNPVRPSACQRSCGIRTALGSENDVQQRADFGARVA